MATAERVGRLTCGCGLSYRFYAVEDARAFWVSNGRSSIGSAVPAGRCVRCGSELVPDDGEPPPDEAA